MEHIVLTGVGMMSAAGTGARPVLDAMASGTHFFNVEYPGKRSLHPRFPWPEASLKEPNVPWPEGGAWPTSKSTRMTPRTRPLQWDAWRSRKAAWPTKRAAYAAEP
jgi:hypothetical protein